MAQITENITTGNIKSRILLEKAGFWSLFLTMFLISFPRTWSLYGQGLFLTIGFGLWVIDFRKYFKDLIKVWYLVLPPVLYFVVHLLSIILEWANFSFLEDRLMFLLVPLLGFPVFRSEHLRSNLKIIFSGFIIGLLLISVFLIARNVVGIFVFYDRTMEFFKWISEHQQDYTSIGFSILEHPTYLAMKISWVIVLLIFFDYSHYLIRKFSIVLILIFTCTLFFLASKAGLLLWFLTILFFLVKKLTRFKNPILYFILIPLFILLTILSAKEIQRVDRFITSVKSDIGSSHPDWKNIDQRTREWYTSLQIIRQKPLFGTGLSKARDTLAEEYLRNNFIDEADLRMNAHNQFLEAQLTFGIGGSISLLFLLFAPLIFRKKIIWYDLISSFVIVIIFFLLIESLFNRQWGIMFFILFYCMLITQTVCNGDNRNHLTVP